MDSKQMPNAPLPPGRWQEPPVIKDPVATPDELSASAQPTTPSGPTATFEAAKVVAPPSQQAAAPPEKPAPNPLAGQPTATAQAAVSTPEPVVTLGPTPVQISPEER